MFIVSSLQKPYETDKYFSPIGNGGLRQRDRSVPKAVSSKLMEEVRFKWQTS